MMLGGSSKYSDGLKRGNNLNQGLTVPQGREHLLFSCPV